MTSDTEQDSSSSWYWTPKLLIANAIIGLILFEWAWYKTYRARNPIK